MFEIRLERIRDLSDSTKDFRFSRTDGKPMLYEPGQFFRFVFTDEKGEFERSYSLCNFDQLHGHHLDVVVSKVTGGRATNLLFNCELGLKSQVTGPFGRLIAPNPLTQRLVMVATSVGLAPLLPILKSLEGVAERILLILGVRDPSEFLYSEYLLDYQRQHPNFELRICYSRLPSVANRKLAAFEYSGYVTQQLPLINVDSQGDHFLLCGNPAMVDDVWLFLKEQGFKPRQVSREKYVFAKRSAKQGESSAGQLSDEDKRLIAEKMKKYQ